MTGPACHRHPHPEWWFPESGDDHESAYTWAQKVCERCPVLDTCRTAALERAEPHGMWGALSPLQRANILRGKPAGPLVRPAQRLRAQDRRARKSKLTIDQQADIIRRYDLHNGQASVSDLAAEHGVSRPTVYRLLANHMPPADQQEPAQ